MRRRVKPLDRCSSSPSAIEVPISPPSRVWSDGGSSPSCSLSVRCAPVPPTAHGCKIARNIDPTPHVSQSVDLVAKDRNLVGSRLDAKRDPTQETDSAVGSRIYVHSMVGSRFDASSHAGAGRGTVDVSFAAIPIMEGNDRVEASAPQAGRPARRCRELSDVGRFDQPSNSDRPIVQPYPRRIIHPLSCYRSDAEGHLRPCGDVVPGPPPALFPGRSDWRETGIRR
jgi:hypothetical protein